MTGSIEILRSVAKPRRRAWKTKASSEAEDELDRDGQRHEGERHPDRIDEAVVVERFLDS